VPDVYSGVDTVITAFFSVYVKFILIVIFIRLATFINVDFIIEAAAISSILLGTLLAIRQLEIKRFIAYSAITHTGFMLLGDFQSM
jgi:NADH-quinone oxidoreductase subunit N